MAGKDGNSLKSEIDQLSMQSLTKILTKSEGWKPLASPIDIGFDSEFSLDPKEVISFQFASKDKSAIYYVNKPEISASEFVRLVLDFVCQCGLQIPKNGNSAVHLISHFAAAELGRIANFLQFFKVRPVNGGLGWEGEFDGDMGESFTWIKDIAADGINIKVIDLFGYFPTSLAAIGEAIGYPKIDVSRYRTQDDFDVGRLYREDRALFEKYAKTDGEICILAWKKLMEEWLKVGVDPHHYPTVQSLAMADFRKNYLKNPMARTDSIIELRNELAGRGPEKIYKPYARRRTVLDIDDLAFDVRVAAMRAYGGGRNESFVRGYLKLEEPWYFYDVVSLYVAASILQPLPNVFTKWEPIISPDDISATEGFVKLEFEFPAGTRYPSLRVEHEASASKMFPRTGIAWTTCAEAREAISMGAKIRIIRGFGFRPTANEQNHDLKVFMGKTFVKKKAAAKGSLEYIVEKRKMVAVIGKFTQRGRQYDSTEMQELRMKFGMSPQELRSPRVRERLRRLQEVGSAWCPEWGALILGRARAIMAQLIERGECAFVSTDGGLFRNKRALFESDAMKALQSVESGLSPESETGEVDEIVVIRTRMYATWFKGQLVKEAHHGVHVKSEDWVKMLRDQVEAKKPLYDSYFRRRLTNIDDVLLYGFELAKDQSQIMRVSWNWDFKRVEHSAVEDPFGSWTWTRPYENADLAAADQLISKRRMELAQKGAPAYGAKTIEEVLPELRGKLRPNAAVRNRNNLVRMINDFLRGTSYNDLAAKYPFSSGRMKVDDPKTVYRFFAKLSQECSKPGSSGLHLSTKFPVFSGYYDIAGRTCREILRELSRRRENRDRRFHTPCA